VVCRAGFATSACALLKFAYPLKYFEVSFN
jgi:hypothetical protein